MTEEPEQPYGGNGPSEAPAPADFAHPVLIASVYIQFVANGRVVQMQPLMYVPRGAMRVVAEQLEQLAKRLRAEATGILVP